MHNFLHNYILSLSPTVFEIFDFKVSRVWPLTFRGHQKSKKFLPFESPCMTSYLTSIDTFSLSRMVPEIFDFKVFRVWPWPLTFEGHQRSIFFSPFESPYMISYLTSIDTFSISYRFRDIGLQSFEGLTLTFDLWRSSEVKNIFTIRKPIHDFLSNFYWHSFSILYGFRDIRLQSF